MSVNMYLKFENPSVQGSVTTPGHTGEMEVLSWNHGFSQPTSPTRGGGGSAGQAVHQNFTFTKYLDSATNQLLRYCWSGEMFAKAKLTCYRQDGDGVGPVAYLTITMQQVIISNYAVNGGPGDIPVENISLDYGVVQYDYKNQKQPKDLAATAPATHNLRTGIVE